MEPERVGGTIEEHLNCSNKGLHFLEQLCQDPKTLLNLDFSQGKTKRENQRDFSGLLRNIVTTVFRIMFSGHFYN